MKKTPVILSIITIFTLTGCTSDKAQKAEIQANTENKNIITIEKTVIDDYYETSAVVKAKTSSNVASKILARVESVNFEEGDTVQKGQLLVELDDNDISAKLESAIAAYNEASKNQNIAFENKKLAEITYERYKNIYEERAITKQELDEVTAKKNIAELECKRAVETMNRTKATLNEAQSVVGYARLYAPISGIITSKTVDMGDTATPGQVLFIIKDLSSLQVAGEVDESYLDKVSIGSPVKIFPEDSKTGIDKEISEVVSSVNSASRSFKIKIDLTSSSFKDGQYVKIAIPVGKRETILVPETAIVKKGQLEGVYFADKTFRLIKTGKSYGEMVEVVSGLEAGERVAGE